MIFGQALLALLGIVHAVGAYFYFSKERYASLWAAAWLCLTALAQWQLPAHPVATGLIFGAVLAAWTWWWESMAALAERNWVPEDARQATATLSGQHLVVSNLRNFEWHTRRDFTPRWEDRSYDIANLDAVDIFVCAWGDPRIAHLIVSFVFSDTLPLAFSIETRRETSEKWSILAGLMKSYELIMIAADERDVIRVRTNIRHECVRRYRILSTLTTRQHLLNRYIEELNEVAARPRFYNTLYRNCTTEVVRMLRETGREAPLDWRLLVTGYLPEYLYEHGLIATEQPFNKVQPAADIGAMAQEADADPAFSNLIRHGGKVASRSH